MSLWRPCGSSIIRGCSNQIALIFLIYRGDRFLQPLKRGGILVMEVGALLLCAATLCALPVARPDAPFSQTLCGYAKRAHQVANSTAAVPFCRVMITSVVYIF